VTSSTSPMPMKLSTDFLENHPRREAILAEGAAILEDPVTPRKLVRNIDHTIVPLLATVYFSQYIDKTTLHCPMRLSWESVQTQSSSGRIFWM
jgi:hypothetical protein